MGPNATATGERAVIDVNSVVLQQNAVLSSKGDMNLTTDSLNLVGNENSKTRVMAAISGKGAGIIAVRKDLSNAGLIYSGHDLDVEAPNITNTNTGGIAALNDLSIKANSGQLDLSANAPSANAGKLINKGTIFAGKNLTLTANGEIQNASSINAGSALTLRTNTLINNRDIISEGSIDVLANTIRNEVGGGDTRQWVSGTPQSVDGASYDDGDQGGNLDVAQDHTRQWTDNQIYANGAPTYSPLIQAHTNLNLTFHEAKNIGGSIFGGEGINLQGFSADPAAQNPGALRGIGIWDDVGNSFKLGGDASFVNDNLALETRNYDKRWTTLTKFVALGPAVYFRDQICKQGTGSYDKICNYKNGIEETYKSQFNNVLKSGIYTKNLTGGGFALVNNGSPSKLSEARAGDSTPGGSRALTNPSVGVQAPSSVIIEGNSWVFGGINIPLPSNPNGNFVIARNPNARYLVETNPLYTVGPGSTYDSDYLASLLGYNSPITELRLGDANYENYLIKQQLIAKIGNLLLDSYENANEQLKGMFDYAAAQQKSLGLVYGQSLTPQQQVGLKKDIVWMVKTVVNGQTVLAPVVYLSEATKAAIAGGGTISVQTAKLNLNSLTNSGGNIIASKELDVTSRGDIVNTSGKIQGSDLSLKSAEGSIINKTFIEGNGNDAAYKTNIGRTASIESTGLLTLDAKKDITVLGANVTAGRDATLKAGEAITFDTVVDKTISHIPGHSDIRTETETNTGSTLKVGGNTRVEARSLTLADSEADLKGVLDAKVDDFNVVARQDKIKTTTSSHTDGLGVGGALWGSVDTKTEDFTGKNAGSKLSVGGDANVQGKNLTLIGSDVNVKGNANIEVDKIRILEGLDEHRSKTEVKTVSVLGGVQRSGSSSAQASTNTSASAPGLGQGGAVDIAKSLAKAKASAEANASAQASSDASVNLFSVKHENTDSYDSKAVASTFNVGGNLTGKANDLTVQGSNLNVGGDASLIAKNINLLAAEEKHTETYSSQENAIKLSSSNNASAEASAKASASLASAKASAQAAAKASTDNVVGYVNTQTQSQEETVNKGVSTIKVGGNSVLMADTLRTQGARVDVGGDLTIDAKRQENLSAESTTRKNSSLQSVVVGGYVKGDVSASANAKASVGVPTGASADANANANANVGTGLNIGYQLQKSESGATTNQVTSYKVGGSLTRTGGDGSSIVDVGSAIDVNGNLTQRADHVDSRAAHDMSYSMTENYDARLRAGVYAEAGADARASAKAGSAGAKAGADATAKAIVGQEVGFSFGRSTDSEKASTAVTSNIRVGGSLQSVSKEKSTFEGTQIDTAGNVNVIGKSVEFMAAQNIIDQSSATDRAVLAIKGGGGVAASAGASKSAGASNTGVSGAKAFFQGEGSASAGYDNTRDNSSKSTSVVSNIKSGGETAIQAMDGNVQLVGTSIDAVGPIRLNARGGSVEVSAARNTSTLESTTVSAGVSVSGQAGGGENSAGLSIRGGYSKAGQSSDHAVATTFKSGGGGVSINADKDVSLEGTQLHSKDGTLVNAKGNVKVMAATDTTSETSNGFKAGISVAVTKQEEGGDPSAGAGQGSVISSAGNTEEGTWRTVGGNLSVQHSRQSGTTYQQVDGTGPIKVVAGGSVAVEGSGVKREDIQAGGGSTFTQVSDIQRKDPNINLPEIPIKHTFKPKAKQDEKQDDTQQVVKAGEAAQERRSVTVDRKPVVDAGNAAKQRRSNAVMPTMAVKR
ncbi:hypothetical protein WK09_32240 [Burkholderia ubonensis]|nr:hypothetical protein WK09_32240 [Burkholderia ubonensis]